MSVRVRIVYEDGRAGAAAVYGPHEFVRACVADRLACDLYDPLLRSSLDAVPLKGIGNVKRALADPLGYRRDGARLVALIDGDEAWRHLGLPRDAGDFALAKALAGDPIPADVSVHVLRDNLETLLRSVLRHTGAEALAHKPSPTVRDRILLSAATSAPSSVRDLVVRDIPAVGALVEEIVALLRPERGVGAPPA